jgi:hypothetical protein
MKKSQLRNIIKESIKGLMTEQWVAPTVGQYYCNINPIQGYGCVEIVSGPSSQPWIAGQPDSMNIGAITGWPAVYTGNLNVLTGTLSPTWYNSQQACESDCGNFHQWDCWSYNNGGSSPNVSFHYLTTVQKNNFCIQCQNDLASDIVKSHHYCWCLDNGSGPQATPPKGTFSPALYVCPDPVNEDRGCMDPNALNYNECCDTTDPNCIPNIDTKECCTYLSVDPCDDFNAVSVSLQQGCCGKCVNGVYTGSSTDQCGILGNPNFCDCCPEPVGDERGCMDSNATNYMECCPQNNYPGCVATIPTNEECCKYDIEPTDDPCITNPKNCWFCKPGGPCKQFSTMSLAFTNSYSGIKYPTAADCYANSVCKPLPNPNDPLDMVDPQIQRMKTLMEYKKPK